MFLSLSEYYKKNMQINAKVCGSFHAEAFLATFLMNCPCK